MVLIWSKEIVKRFCAVVERFGGRFHRNIWSRDLVKKFGAKLWARDVVNSLVKRLGPDVIKRFGERFGSTQNMVGKFNHLDGASKHKLQRTKIIVLI